MKVRVLRTSKQIEEAVYEEVTRQTQENYERITYDGAMQMLSTVFYTLHKKWGFGTKRLIKLKDDVEDEFFMMKKGIFGKTYSPDDTLAYCKDILGIDLMVSQYEGD